MSARAGGVETRVDTGTAARTTNWVKAKLRRVSDHPFFRISSHIVSRASRQVSTGPESPKSSTPFTPRS